MENRTALRWGAQEVGRLTAAPEGADTCFRAEYRLTGPVAALRCGPSEPAAAGLRRGRAGYPPAAILPAADGGAGSAAGRGSGAGIRPGGLASRMGRRVSRTGTAGGRSVPPGRAAAVSGPALPGGRPLPADRTVLSGQRPNPPGPGVGHFCTGRPGDIKNLHLRYHIL